MAPPNMRPTMRRGTTTANAMIHALAPLDLGPLVELEGVEGSET